MDNLEIGLEKPPQLCALTLPNQTLHKANSAAVPLGAAGAPGSECRGGQRLQRQWPGLSTCTRCLMGRCLGTDDQVHHGLLRRSLR
ncbi:unnamed protein product [Cladocopium goreaui]|uniref:Uncharacterized protein n=1 Tax=Cladocopium goreaui TaxID=2562237 RepID=A0A9P1D322_9DINO|nr:unnamed protein product [Cladocopium goreaui]